MLSVAQTAKHWMAGWLVSNEFGKYMEGSLSDHEAQLIEINNTDLQPRNQQYQKVRKINKHMIADFVTKLSNESRDTVFYSNDIDSKFNCFLNTYWGYFIQAFL
jgi:hypothetical protein